MPVIKSAKKKLRADERKKVFNKAVRDKVKIALKQFKIDPSSKTLNAAYSSLDTASKKHVIPKERADRKKGRLSASLQKIKGTRSKIVRPKSETKGRQTKKSKI